MPKPFTLTLVEQSGPAADSNLWHHPDFAPELFKQPAFWEGLARRLEAGGFDAIFFADTPAIRADTPYQRDHALANGGGTRLDPAFVIPIMAAVTERLGFVVTTSISYDHPSALARKYSTLDHLTQGRIGWNIVANNVKSAALNHGLKDQLPHDVRYDRGDEFMDVVYALWNRSWEDGSVPRDSSRNIYSDPNRIHKIQHRGRWFDVEAIHITEPSPQRTPVLFQAGSSARGQQFAATHAECIYLNTTTFEETQRIIGQIKVLAGQAGRDPRNLLCTPRIIPVVAETEQKAREKFQSFLDAGNPEDAVIVLQQWAGIDLRGRDPDEVLDIAALTAASGELHAADHLRRLEQQGRRFTVAQLLREYAFGGGLGNVLVGTPDRIADILERYVDEGGAAGFNVAYMIRSQSVDEFIELVIPELRRRGRIAPPRDHVTLRERLFGAGPYLPADHPANRIRPVLLPP